MHRLCQVGTATRFLIVRNTSHPFYFKEMSLHGTYCIAVGGAKKSAKLRVMLCSKSFPDVGV